MTRLLRSSWLLALAMVAAGVQAQVTTEPIQAHYPIADGRSATVAVRLTNEGSGTTEVQVEWLVPAPLVLVMPSPGSVTLEANETRALFATVAVPRGLEADGYLLEVRVTTPDGQSSVPIRIDVAARSIIELTELGGDGLVGGPVGVRTATMVVTNRGNTAESLRFVAATSPRAEVSIEPSAAELMPGAELLLEVTVDPNVPQTGTQRVTVEARREATGDPLASAGLAFRVLSSEVVIRPAERDLRFVVRLGANPGQNFNRGGLDMFRLSLRGGGRLTDDGSTWVHGSLNVHGSGAVAFSASYVSPSLDVRIGPGSYNLSSLTYSGRGEGVDAVARLPEFGVAFRAFVYAHNGWAGYRGAGGQITAALWDDSVRGSLQFVHDAAAGRGVLSLSGSLVPSMWLGSTDSSEEQDEAGEGATDAVAEVRQALDDAESEGGVDVEEIDPDAIAEAETATVDALLTQPSWPSARVGFEVGVDTVEGLAGRVDGALGWGPLTLSAVANGMTTGFAGARGGARSLEFRAGTSAVLGGLPLQASASVGRSEALAVGGAPLLTTDTLSLGAAIHPGGARLGLVYTTSTSYAPHADAWTVAQRFSVALHGRLGLVPVGATVRLADVSASGTGSGARSVDGDFRVTVPLSRGTWRSEMSWAYDLTRGQLLHLQAESIAVLAGVGRSTQDLRFGARYRTTPTISSLTGLITWGGDIRPGIRLQLGADGTVGNHSPFVTTWGSSRFDLQGGQALNLGWRLRFSPVSSPTVALSASYSVPFSVTVGRRAGLGDVRGRVTDEAGEPMPGVVLHVSRATVVTDENGAFAVRGLPVGMHAIHLGGSLDGFLLNSAMPQAVAVEDGQTSELQWVAVQAGMVEGMVRFVTPEPRSGVLFGIGDPIREASLVRGMTVRLVGDDASHEVASNAAGRFAFPAMLPGRYRVEVVTELGDLYRVDLNEATILVGRGEVVAVEVTIHPLPREIEMQNSTEGGS